MIHRGIGTVGVVAESDARQCAPSSMAISHTRAWISASKYCGRFEAACGTSNPCRSANGNLLNSSRPAYRANSPPENPLRRNGLLKWKPPGSNGFYKRFTTALLIRGGRRPRSG